MAADTPPFIVAIPARYASTRLPGKPLQMLDDAPLIAHVVRRAQAAGATQVVVATDDARVGEALRDMAVDVCLTRADHASGTDRLAECAQRYAWADDAIVVNLQGDEPFAPADGIRAVASALAEGDAPMATLAAPLDTVHELMDPHCVKLVCDRAGDALYFSRAAIPWVRDQDVSQLDALPRTVPFLRHIGIYAYRAGFLQHLAALTPTPLERAEALEQLRAREHGFAIAVRLTPEPFPPGIDTPEDLHRARRWLCERTS